MDEAGSQECAVAGEHAVGRAADGAEPARYRHEALAVILQVRSEADACVLSVLAWRRRRAPFAGDWALPSGPVGPEEAIGASVRRHLATQVDLAEIAHLEQLRTLSAPGRDPSQRTIATAYLGLVPATSRPRLPAHAAWLPVDALQPMAFDHAHVVGEGVARMRSKLSYTNIAFALAPPEFTLAELRDIYEAALDQEVAVTNLQRILVRRGQLAATGGLAEPGEHGGRPARLYRFTTRELEVTDPFAVLKPSR
ncbi:MAG: NUDIX domain-containing protein [Propionibacteriaceae bacterium]|nr:NUDIX domain-containing protein [Propionibacteriaceae bacterium]